MPETTKTRYTAHDIFSSVINRPLPYDEGIAVLEGNPRIAALNKKVPGPVSYYSFTLFLSGEMTLRFNNMTFKVNENDLFICPPGMSFDVMECSDDVTSVCIMAEESFTYQLSEVRDIIRAAYFPIIHHVGAIKFPAADARRLKDRMYEIENYYNNIGHIHKTECLRLLYNMLILDILNIESRLEESELKISERAENIFIDFIDLIHKYAVKHHDIPFYADQLSITPIYLSRVVKNLTGRTVMDFVSQMLLIESSSLLRGTDLPVAAIAERVNFATAAAFTKFFTREMGISPSVFRRKSIK